MGWEGGGRYYTRSRRVNGRVVREYVGSGVLAQLEADRDRQRRQQEAAELRSWHREREQVFQLEEELVEVDTLCALVMCATLEAAGYHQHDRGEWRKRRG